MLVRILLAFLLGVSPMMAQTPQRPNIVLILLDDVGFSDLGAYGSEIKTPNIDELAAKGVKFTNFHTAATCESSRALIYTGVDNHLAGQGNLQVVLADEQKGKPGYEGYINDKTYSIAQVLKNAGYSTYFAGKWHGGHGLERSPGSKGFERYVGLENTGADNYEEGKYAPLQKETVWWEDGKRLILPNDFFSTKYYTDKLLSYMSLSKGKDAPFFAVLAPQANHFPHQAPQADIDKYMGKYDSGWADIAKKRYEAQVKLGLTKEGLVLPKSETARDWDKLSADEVKVLAKKQAAYAAMLDNADQHIGRIVQAVREQGKIDNTVFIVMSDNGADPFDLTKLNLPFRLWYLANYSQKYETLGQKGTFNHYGEEWAAVSNTPFAGAKGMPLEGGMRVPFILSYPAKMKAGKTDSFMYASDIFPTLLELASVTLPLEQGKYTPTGKSVLPHLNGATPTIHDANAFIGYEATGGVAIFKGDYKLVKGLPPFVHADFRLYNLKNDPTESVNLAVKEPKIYAEMLKDVETYYKENNVVVTSPDYSPLKQLLKNQYSVLLYHLWHYLLGLLLIALALVYGLYRGVKRVVKRA